MKSVKYLPDKLPIHAGFALVITLVLCVLLALLAVGLLSLSSVTLQSAGHGQAMLQARANARMALTLAIGELQKEMGPDKRISAPADQFLSANEEPALAPENHFTVSYDSWDAGVQNRPDPHFRKWLISGLPAQVQDPAWRPDDSDSLAVTSAKDGSSAVKVPKLAIKDSQNKLVGNYGWWISDLGTKAYVGEAKESKEDSLALVSSDGQSLPTSPLEVVRAGSSIPYQGVQADDAKLSRITTNATLQLLAQNTNEARKNFHDLTSFNRGLLSNVRSGGFRKDLSMYFEVDQAAQAPDEPLYSVQGRDGINMKELWVYYNLYRKLEYSAGAGETFTTGDGKIDKETPYLKLSGNMATDKGDDFYYYRQPLPIRIETLISLHVREGSLDGKEGYFLQAVVDPIVTYWNPYDVPLVMKPAYNSIKFWQIPYDIRLQVGTQAPMQASLRREFGGNQYHYMTLVIGTTEPVVMKPGEVLVFSQGANTAITDLKQGLNYIDARCGWNFGGGAAYDLIDNQDKTIFFEESTIDTPISYEFFPNNEIATNSSDAHHALITHGIHYGEDRGDPKGGRRQNYSFTVGNINIDSKSSYAGTKQENERMFASDHPEVFPSITGNMTRTFTVERLINSKAPVLMYSIAAKTEKEVKYPTRFLSHLNPQMIKLDWADFSQLELELWPYEINISPVFSNLSLPIELTVTGNGYFGGGTNPDKGVPAVITHSIPRSPTYSLAALQNATANGYGKNQTKPTGSRSPLLPFISHPIGNSFLPSMIDPTKSEASGSQGMSYGRDLADHSYLANEALWDSWFFSGIAPQNVKGFANQRDQKQVATDFFGDGTPLPLHRYRAAMSKQKVNEVLSDLFSGNKPSAKAFEKTAGYLEVEGMFNVNSTSIEAWRVMLSALRERASVVSDDGGKPTVKANTNTPVAHLAGARDGQVDASAAVAPNEPFQWTGYRTLTDSQIDELARAIVNQVRERGPFLSLGDFVNRRLSTNEKLNISGAVQSALDSPTVSINQGYRNSDRQVDTGDMQALNKKAEQGPAATGIPGIVSQADILTPLAPYLSVRSDSFLIRTAGQSIAANGKVEATAYCEAIVQRTADFVDPSNTAMENGSSLSPNNRKFGRKFIVTSFRWLSEEEIL